MTELTIKELREPTEWHKQIVAYVFALIRANLDSNKNVGAIVPSPIVFTTKNRHREIRLLAYKDRHSLGYGSNREVDPNDIRSAIMEAVKSLCFNCPLHRRDLEDLVVEFRFYKEGTLMAGVDYTGFDGVLEGTSDTFLGDHTGYCVRKFRGRVLVDTSDISWNEIFRRMKMASEWLLRMKRDDQFLLYKYLPDEDKYPVNEDNMIRQLGTLWIVAKYAALYQDDKMRKLALHGIAYFLRTHGEWTGRTEGYRVGKNIACSAFILLALIELNIEKEIQLALYGDLKKQQCHNGGFETHYESSDQNMGINYYPGEALTAMATYAEASSELEKMFDVHKNAFDFYHTHFMRAPHASFVPWHTQAYAKAYYVTGIKNYADFVFEMNDWLIENHQVEQNFPDDAGGFNKPPGSGTPAYCEGLVYALSTANAAGDKERVASYTMSLFWALRFCLQLQCDNVDAGHFQEPDKVAGGVFRSLRNSEQRIDATQHYLHTLMLVKDLVF